MPLNHDTTAVVLLHGVGDQNQRGTLEGFLGSLGKTGASEPGRERTLRELPDETDASSYFLNHTTIHGQTVDIAEYYWADISRVRRGLFSILRNFFQLIVDAPDIIYACLGPRLTGESQRDFFVLRCFRSLLAVMIWLIYFPIVALNIAYALLVGEFALHAAWTPQVTVATTADGHFAVASGILLVLLAGSGMSRKVNSYWRSIVFMVAGVLLGVLIYSLSNLVLRETSVSYGQYATVFNGALNGLWSVVTAISLLYLIAVPFLCLFFYRRWRSILLGFTTAFVIIRFWLAFITTIWLVYLTSVFDGETYDSLISSIGGPIRFISVMWFDVIVVGLFLGTSLIRYVLQTAAAEGEITGRRYPRLIIPSALPFIAMVLAVAGTGVIVACNCALILEQCPQLTCSFVYAPSEWIFTNAATLLAVGGVVIQLAHSRFNVAIDIVNFFKSDRGHRRANPFVAVSSVFATASPDAVGFRHNLRARLDRLVEDISAARGPYRRIILIGHSLGSVIAIDWLMRRQGADKDDSQFELMTLGSPYGAIFHHYFPHMFAPPQRPDLLPRISRWTNIYRENDFVGTSLAGGGIDDIVQPPRGHIGYFADNDVVREIATRIAAKRG